MKKILMVVALAATTAIAGAQDGTVTFEKVLDTATAAPGAQTIGSSTYVPVADKFIAGKRAGEGIAVFNAATGAYETNMALGTITPSGTGVFAITATEDGVIYGYEGGSADLWRWGSISDTTPVKVYDTPAFSRVGYTGTVGSDVVIAFTGAAGQGYGNVEFFSDTFPFSTNSFTFNESVDLDAKSALAINNEGTEVFTVGDTGATALQKWVKTDGVWGAAPAWQIGTKPVPPATTGTGPGGGPMAYDNVHDILFMIPQPGAAPKKLIAYDGADGTVLGEITLTTTPNATTGNSGGFVIPTATGGTIYMIAPATTATNAAMYVYTYEVEGSSVDDWSLYQQ